MHTSFLSRFLVTKVTKVIEGQTDQRLPSPLPCSSARLYRFALAAAICASTLFSVFENNSVLLCLSVRIERFPVLSRLLNFAQNLCYVASQR